MRIDRDVLFPLVRAGCFGGILTRPQVDGINVVLDEWDARMIDSDPRYLADMLATAEWETAHTMQPVREAYWLSEAWRKANLRYYPYYGRGLVQLTWDYNYDKAGVRLGIPLKANPDMALESRVAVDVMFLGMTEGWFTGRRLSDYFGPGREDWTGARSIINPGDHAEEIGSLGQVYHRAIVASLR